MISINSTPSFKRVDKTDYFRDNELFNEETDKADNSYSQYDYNDLPVKKYNRRPVCEEYLRYYNLTTKPGYKIDTEPLSRRHYAPPKEDTSLKTTPKTVEERLYDVCILKGKNGEEFSSTLHKYLKILYTNNSSSNNSVSTRELIDICKTSKLKKSDGTECVNFKMLDAGVYWANRFISNDNSDFKRVLKSFVAKDPNGDEFFLEKADRFLKNYHGTKLTPKKCEEVMGKSVKYTPKRAPVFDTKRATSVLESF